MSIMWHQTAAIGNELSDLSQC